MQEVIKLREWVEEQCLLCNPITCADILNKIDEIIDADIENKNEWKSIAMSILNKKYVE